MKNTIPGIFEKAFPGILHSENNDKDKRPDGLPEDFFFHLAQSTRDIIFHAQILPEFKFDYVSPSCFAITGYTQEEFYADPLLVKKCWYSDDVDRVNGVISQEVVDVETPQEIRWIRKDGTVIWIEHLIMFEKNKEGVPVSCQIIARDITSRKKAEEAYQEHQIFTNNLLAQAPHATVVINADSSIRYVNPTWEKLNGWSLSEVVGLKAPYPWWPKLSENDLQTWLTAFMESFKKKGGQGELPAVKKNGDFYWIDMTWTTVFKDGEVDYLLINSVDVTERKKAEKALQDSESKFAHAFNSSPDIMAITDKETGKFVEVNESYLRFSGYTREEVIGRTPDQIKNWADIQDRDRMFELLKKDGRVYSQEFRFLTKSGETRNMLFSMEQIMVADKPCYMSVSTDITERKKAEAALKASEEKFSKVYNFSPNAICIVDVVSGKFTDTNESFERFCGYSREEIIGRTSVEMNLFVDAADEQKMGESLKASGKLDNMQMQSRRKSGEIRHGLFSGETIEIGGVKQLMLVITDITGEVNANKALKDSESKFALAFNASPDIMAITEKATGTFFEVNDAFVKLSGYTREEAIGRRSDELNSWADTAERDRMLKLMNENGRVFSEEFRFLTKFGEVRNMLFSMEQINIADKQYYISVSTDITERKKMEAALKSSEEKFSKVYNVSPNAIALMTGDYKFIEANESFYRYTGYTREEIIGHNHVDLALCANLEDQIYIGKCLESMGHVTNKRINCRTKSGELRAGLFSADLVMVGGEKRAIIIITDISEQVKATEALLESEEKFSKAFRDSPEIIAITSLKDGRWIDINESFTKSTGYSREEVIGKTVKDIKVWANENERDERFKLLFEQGRVINREYEFCTKSGDIRTWLYSAELLTIKGEPCIMSASIDITERKNMEKALADEAIRRRILIEQSSDGIVILDETGKVYDVNWRFAEMLGYNMEEASRLYVWDWEKGFTPQNLLKQLKNVNSEGDKFVTHHMRKDGSFIDVEISTNGATFAGQKLVFCVCRDISERNRMEKALRESEEKFSLAFNASPHMMVITDILDGQYVEVNDSFISKTGYKREEIIGKTQEEVPLWATPDEAERMANHMQAQGSIRNEEYAFRTRSGEIRTWLCSADIVSIGGKQRMLAIAADITERKQAEAMLMESEEKFSRAFNASPISLSISRIKDTAFLEVNESFLRDKGYTRDEIIGKSSREIGIWACEEEQRVFMGILKEQGHVHNLEMHYYTKSGETRTGQISAELINIGSEPCMLVLNNDITQQKQAEEQLRLLSSVTKQVTDCTTITDPEFKITFVNQAGLDMFGYTLDEIKGQELCFNNVIPPNDQEKMALKQAMDKGSVYTAVISKKRKDGTIIICDCRISPMYDENGRLISFIDVQRDITKQKDVEAKLQEHKKLIDSILATMPEGVLVLDNKERILLANKALYNILHIKGRLTRNKPLSEILPLDQYFNIQRALTSGSSDNTTVEFRYNVQGTEKIIYCVIVKMGGERTLMTFADVTREREEEEKMYLTDRLASIGEMAAGLAHELNNPLTGILTLSQVMVNSDLPQENKEDIECIYAEAKRAAGIVKNVLLFARSKPEESSRTNVNEAIKDILRLREYEQRTSNIKVVAELEESLPDIAIDRGQIQQVFLNMISNAEAAIREAERPGTITIATERANNHVNISITDNGCGIKKQILPRIFDPFFTTKEVGKGTGLGLSICYSIIIKHGGKISVKSQVNEGTTFTIRMPIVSQSQ